MGERSEQINTQGVKHLNAKNYAAAAKFFAEAFRIDHNLNAAYNLGFCFFNGYGVEKNYAKALQWFYLLRDSSGSAADNATYLTGIIYDNGGYGVRSDKALAKEFYLKGMENKHAWSWLQYGRILQFEGDYAHARDYIKQAMAMDAKDYSLQTEGKRLLKFNTLGRLSSGQIW